MLMDIQNNKEWLWENLLEQAAEDITTYYWAIQEWTDTSEDYSKSYLFMLAQSHRSRGRHALQQINDNVPDDDIKYKNKLEELFSKAEAILRTQYTDNQIHITALINEEIIPLLEYLKKDIKRLAQIACESGFLSIVTPDFRDTAHDISLRFPDVALVNEEIEKDFFKKTMPDSFKKFCSKFDEVEHLFEEHYGYFYVLKALYPNIQEREYFLERWWLAMPDPEDIPEKNLLKKLRSVFQSQDSLPAGNCPEYGTGSCLCKK